MKKNIFIDMSNCIRIPASQLQEGMFVAELDCSWLETPFLLQGFVIRRQSEIRKLQELCNHVYVEKEGRLWGDKKDPFKRGFGANKRNMQGDDSGLQARARRKQNEPSLASSINTRPEFKVKTAVAEEHKFALKTYQYAKTAMVDILEQARLGNALETETAKVVVKQCVDSILRNPYALMWMAKIKHVDDYTLEHCLNVCVLAIAFGRHLRMDEARLEKLGICGLMHDVGKMQIPGEILNKPGELTKEEHAVMQTHTLKGRDLLIKNKNALSFTIDVAMNHHERIDGKGYPRGLHAAEMSDYTRIIAIVDAFDAMTSERCYSRAKSTLGALKEIYNKRGKQFDEELALEFIQIIGPYPPGTIVKLKNGCVGIVLSSELKKRHLPIVKIVLDENKQQQEPELINLLDVSTGTIPKTYLISRVLKDGDHGVNLEDYPVRSIVVRSLSSEDGAEADDDQLGQPEEE